MAGLGSWISLPPSAIDQRNSAGAPSSGRKVQLIAR
jgi:hypothetical protein